MPLDPDQELLEHELRLEQMKTSIDTGRLNMEKMQADMRWENRKFGVQAIAAAAVCLGAGIALANYVNSRSVPPAPPLPPQIIYLVPGPAPTLSTQSPAAR